MHVLYLMIVDEQDEVWNGAAETWVTEDTQHRDGAGAGKGELSLLYFTCRYSLWTQTVSAFMCLYVYISVFSVFFILVLDLMFFLSVERKHSFFFGFLKLKSS